MGASRAKMLDTSARPITETGFRMYTPVTAGRNPIYVHAKVMIVDEYSSSRSLVRIANKTGHWG